MQPVLILKCRQIDKVTRLGKPAVHRKHQKQNRATLGDVHLSETRDRLLKKKFN